MKRVLPLLAATGAARHSDSVGNDRVVALEHRERRDRDELFAAHVASSTRKSIRRSRSTRRASEIVAYLQKLGVKSPKVPQLKAVDDPTLDAKELEREVNGVASSYGAKTGGSRTITYAAIAGMLSSVKDKYTTFLTPAEYKMLNEGLDGGNFSGVGIAIRIDEKTKLLTVNEVIPDGPAEKAGLQAGDVITLIDGKSTKGLTSDQDAKLLRGEKGTQVHLTIERNGADAPGRCGHARHHPSAERLREASRQRHRLRAPLGLRLEHRARTLGSARQTRNAGREGLRARSARQRRRLSQRRDRREFEVHSRRVRSSRSNRAAAATRSTTRKTRRSRRSRSRSS